MADFTALKTAIQNAIKQNGNNAITGNLLQDILISMVSTLGDSAINGLASSLSTETTNRQNADGTLQSAINTINTKLSDGYAYVGIATPTKNPSTTSGKVFYIATTAGTYTNFHNSSSQPLVLTQGINILKYNGTSWSVEQVWGVDDVPTAVSNNLVKSGGVQNELALGAVYDVSAKNPTAGPNNDGKWESLSALLSDANLNTLIPTSVRKGGMSIKYVCSSDNKYVQFRNMNQNWSTTVTDWQGVDDEPTAGSENLVKSGGVFKELYGTNLYNGNLSFTGSAENQKILDVVFGGEKINIQVLSEIDYTLNVFVSVNNDFVKLATISDTNIHNLDIPENISPVYGLLINNSGGQNANTVRIIINQRDSQNVLRPDLSPLLNAISDKPNIVQLGFTSSIPIDSLENGIVNFTSANVPTGLPDTSYGEGATIITSRVNNSSFTNFDRQVIITPDVIATRCYYSYTGGWQNWTVNNISQRIDSLFSQIGVITDASAITANTLQNGIISFTATVVPNGFPNIEYGEGCETITCRKAKNQWNNWDRQFVITNKAIATRVYYGSWQDWSINHFEEQRVVTCGVGKDYTRLRDAIAFACLKKGSKVIVYPGTYDLTQEFATELETHPSSAQINLTNDVHVLFMSGAYVTCMVDASNEWAYERFEPFKAVGDFTLENLNIKAKNTRYCVHDELSGGNVQYHHKYINCIMEYTNDSQRELATITQCIGGGLGQNGYIEIIGGKYKSSSVYTHGQQTLDDMQTPITYHNGNNAASDCKIVIRDVYLADKGYLRFGNYGPSTILTPVFVSGCRMYKPVLLMNEQEIVGQVTNFEIISYNNEIVNP